jgi:hypothetical protein
MRKQVLALWIVLASIGSSSAQAFRWATRIGGKLDDISRDMVTDSTGRSYVMGVFSDTVDVDPGPASTTLASRGETDIFIASYSSAGVLLWARQIGGTAEDYGIQLHLDVKGHLLICGYFKGISDMDPGAGTYTFSAGAQQHGFVCRLGSNGDFQQARQFAGNSVQIADLTSDVSGYYITGEFYQSVDLDPGTATDMHTSNGQIDALVSHLDTAMNFIWGKNFGGSEIEAGTHISVESGHLFIAGHFRGTADLDPGTGVHAATETGGQGDIFVLSLSAQDGAYEKHGVIGATPTPERVNDMMVRNGSIWLTGWYSGSTDFDPQAGQRLASYAGGEDMFVLRISVLLDLVWLKTINGPANEEGRGVYANAANHVFVTGYFEQTVDLDPGEYELNRSSAGGADIFALQLNEYGVLLCIAAIGGPGSDAGVAIAVDTGNNVYFSGSYAGYDTSGVDFDTGTGTYVLPTVSAGYDVFVASFRACVNSSSVPASAAQQPFAAYPNPSGGRVSFNGMALPASIEVFDATGTSVFAQELVGGSAVDLGSLAGGLYFIRVYSAGETRTVRMVLGN